MATERNHELELAWEYVEHTGVSIFLTGKAGTGKTTFLHTLRNKSSKSMVVVAPTGVAAINAGGVTIHSFFQLPLSPYIPGNEYRDKFNFSKEKLRIIRALDLLVIDEISMVRADLLDRIDDTLRQYRDRTRPFGGIQLLLIGDLMQLAPVTKDSEWQMLASVYDTPFFFSSTALRRLPYVTIELSPHLPPAGPTIHLDSRRNTRRPPRRRHRGRTQLPVHTQFHTRRQRLDTPHHPQRHGQRLQQQPPRRPTGPCRRVQRPHRRRISRNILPHRPIALAQKRRPGHVHKKTTPTTPISTARSAPSRPSPRKPSKSHAPATKNQYPSPHRHGKTSNTQSTPNLKP